MTAINSSASNQFNAFFHDPGLGGSASINGFDVAANTIRVFAGGRNLGNSTLGIGGPGGFTVSSTTPVFINNAISRGQGDGTTAATLNKIDQDGNIVDQSAYDFGPWGGAITFNTEKSWYFDSDISTEESFAGNNDFYSVALHELAHLLGFGTSDSWRNLVNGDEFVGVNSSLENQGSVLLDANEIHWLNGTTSSIDGEGDQEVLLDPSVTTGTRKHFTDLDLAGLQDVGWEVSAIPVPAAVYFFGSALLGLGAFRKKTK